MDTMPEMMRKKAMPTPTLEPIMVLSLSLARELCAALCETCVREGKVRTREVKFSCSGTVVLLGLGIAVLVPGLDADALDALDIFAGCGVNKEKRKHVWAGDFLVVAVGIIAVCSDVDRLRVDRLAALESVENSTQDLLDVDGSKPFHSLSPLVI
jgi:hypothetical protein